MRFPESGERSDDHGRLNATFRIESVSAPSHPNDVARDGQYTLQAWLNEDSFVA